MSANSTRRKGTSKPNCSDKFIEVNRAIDALPSHLGRWLKYRYDEAFDQTLADSLFDLVIQDVQLDNQQKRTREKSEALVTRHILTRHELNELPTKELVKVLGVGRNMAITKYKPQSQKISLYLKTLDVRALNAFYQRFHDNKCK